MDILCVLLAGAALAFAFLWRLERSWFLARDEGCFCRRGRGGAVEVNPEGCPVHDPETWRTRLHADFARLLEKEMSAREAAPDVSAPPARMKWVQRIRRFRPDRRDLDYN
jgi:hypothetical protein